MLGKDYFYHKSVRKMVAIFGTIFNNITIERHDSENNPIGSFQVPIAYAPRQKFLSRLQEDYKLLDASEPGSTTNPKIQISLPRMSYDLTDLNYDPARKLSAVGKCVAKDPANNEILKWAHNPIPYNFLFTLNLASVTQTDSLQMLEQILPFFKPQFNITINEFPEIGIIRDIPITFSGSATPDDTFEGDLLTRRFITYTLIFTMRGYIYGPVESSKIIRESIVNASIVKEFVNINPDDSQTERTTVTPEPGTANADDEFGFKIIRTSIS